jgi:hypothetical protein
VTDALTRWMIRWGLRTISTIGTHELDGGTLRLFLTTKLEAKMANETEKQGDKSHTGRTACIA